VFKVFGPRECEKIRSLEVLCNRTVVNIMRAIKSKGHVMNLICSSSLETGS
jgi:hypothetical protein